MSRTLYDFSRVAPLAGAAVLATCAAIPFPGRDYALVALMFGLPLLDRGWRPSLPQTRAHIAAWTALSVAGAAVLLMQPQHLALLPVMLLFAALPEEWFFRAWLQARLGTGLKANLHASLVFALVHGLARGWLTGTLVFLPSLAYGWLYQRTRDLPLLVLVHLLSNLIYAAYIGPTMESWLGRVFG